MATITIRDLEDSTKQALRERSARNGRSMEAEARAILDDAVRAPAEPGLATRIHRRALTVGGAELVIPDRSDQARPAVLDE